MFSTMKRLILGLCLYLIQAAVASEADVLAALQAQKIPLAAQLLSGEELTEYLQKNQKFFEVEDTPAGDDFESRLMDLSFIDQNRKPVVQEAISTSGDIPESFDARTQWPQCSSLRHIRDQANCGSCWAVATASAISDRICISSNGRRRVHVSATDILSCCGRQCGRGCSGGFPIEAWRFFARNGSVTGGDYRATGCCRPYPFHPCGRHGNEPYYGECRGTAVTPLCRTTCVPGYRRSYRQDKTFGRSAYALPNSVTAIQREIMRNGPVVSSFTTYDDFSRYRRGIYRHTAGRARGSHAVKIIGWGREGDVPYWLIANSFHSDWGENGYFRMIRGINDCGIEEHVVAGSV
ncbi:hypothetical protein V3C99_005936 [Haemonchus contortus]